MTTSPNVMVYAALDAWRRQMVERGHDLLDAALTLANDVRERIEHIPDLEVLDRELLGHQASHDLGHLPIVMDIEATGTSGYQGADWIREHCQLDLHVSDHRRMVATMSFADDDHTTDRLVAARV
jgi:arginine decarboxylase